MLKGRIISSQDEYVIIALVEVPLIFNLRNNYQRGLVEGFKYACKLDEAERQEKLKALKGEG